MTETINFLERLIAFPTVSSESNLPLIDFVDNFLQKCGFETHQIKDKTDKKAGLLACLGTPTHGGIMLSAHSDVVPVTSQKWDKEPFRLTQENNRLYGRGTTDMKGFLASMMNFAQQASTVKLKEPLKICLSYDEEIGCVGIKDMIPHIKSCIGLPRACLVGEPTLMQVATGHKSKTALRATCYGTNGHSAIAPQLLNALHLATEFIAAICSLQDDISEKGPFDSAYDISYSTLHVGKLSGGIALNIVPDQAIIDFELRSITEDQSKKLLQAVTKIAQDITKRHTPKFPNALIEIKITYSYPGLNIDETDDFVNYTRQLTGTSSLIKVPFGTEAGYFSEHLGIPTVICGPGSMIEQGHRADEFIEKDQLNACDKMLQKLLDGLKA